MEEIQKYMNKRNNKISSFLTLDEVKQQGLRYCIHTQDRSVYSYSIKKGMKRYYTLVEDDKPLIKHTPYYTYFAKGTFSCTIFVNKSRYSILMQNNKVLCINGLKYRLIKDNVFAYKTSTGWNFIYNN